jgi:hypothetical protein
VSIWDYRTTTTDQADDQAVYPRTPKTDPDATCKVCGQATHPNLNQLNNCLRRSRYDEHH